VESTQNTWLAVTDTQWHFGLRTSSVKEIDWKQAIRGALRGTLELTADGWLLERHDHIGRFTFAAVETVTAGRGASTQFDPHAAVVGWAEPHPCPGVGRIVGFMTVAWRQTLPVEERGRLSATICHNLQGLVLRDGVEWSLDPLVLSELELETFTNKYGRHTFLFEENPEYARYVATRVASAARRAGLDAYPDAGGRFHVSGGKKGANPTVEFWHFCPVMFSDLRTLEFLRD
jgi:hypothetical protein